MNRLDEEIKFLLEKTTDKKYTLEKQLFFLSSFEELEEELGYYYFIKQMPFDNILFAREKLSWFEVEKIRLKILTEGFKYLTLFDWITFIAFVICTVLLIAGK